MQEQELAIGVDIGGTKSNVAVIRKSGEIIELSKFKTPADHPEQLLAELKIHIKKIIDKYDKIKGIGIASAGRTIYAKRKIGYATDNLKDWTKISLVESLERAFKLPIYLDNDVNAALLAELKLNEDFNDKIVIFLTIGTGLGGALAINGKVVRGKTGSVGEFGHLILYPEGKDCNCGKKGCAEQYISGTAYKARLRKKLKENNIDFKKEDLEPKIIEEKIFQKNNFYYNTLKEMTVDLTYLLESLKNCLDYDLCIIGGGFSVYEDLILAFIKEEFQQYNHKYYEKPEFIFSQLGNEAGVIGAGMMVF